MIVLSRDALASRWVREELNTAVVRRIEGKCRVLPIVLDGVEVPEAIRATVWQPIADVSSYEDEYERILATMFDRTLAPPVGRPPAHAEESTLIDDLPQGAVAVLNAIAEHVMESEQEFIGDSETFDEIRAKCGLGVDQFVKELTRLGKADYIDIAVRRATVSHGKLLLKGLLGHLQATGYDIDQAYASVVGVLLNTDSRTLPEIATATGQPPLVVDAMFELLELLELQDLVTVGRYMGGRDSTRIPSTDPLLEDELA